MHLFALIWLKPRFLWSGFWPWRAMSVKRRRINSKEEWADAVVQTALTEDWVTRHETLDLYMRSRSLRELIPARLSPCQSKYGILTSMKASPVIALPEYCPSPVAMAPPLTQKKITSYFLPNDQPKWGDTKGSNNWLFLEMLFGIARPTKKNALSVRMLHALQQCIACLQNARVLGMFEPLFWIYSCVCFFGSRVTGCSSKPTQCSCDGPCRLIKRCRNPISSQFGSIKTK